MKKTIKFLLIILLVLPLCSCWDSKHLEELLIVNGIGIDISKDNPNNYLFTIAFPTITEDAPKKKATFSTEAPSLSSGKSNLQQKIYRELSYDNIRLIIFSEEVARQGLLIHLDSMLRIPLFRGTTRFVVVKDRAIDLFGLEPPVYLFIINFIFDSIEQNHNATTVPITTLRNFSNLCYTTGIEPSMPYISYGANKSEVNIDSIALFKHDKMIHVLNGMNSRAFMALKGDIQHGVHTFEYIPKGRDEKEYISINLINGKSKIKTKLIDSELHIYQDISISAHLGEYTQSEFLFTPNKVKMIEDIINGEYIKAWKETLEILQKDLKNDNIGYGRYVKANHPDYFDEEDWNNQFSQAIIHVTPKVRIRTVGITP